jgi:hypothetical protein
LHTHFEETAPHVKWQYVNETVYELFHTYCFQFDMDDTKYPPDVRLWDREISLAAAVDSADALLELCDKGLIEMLGREVGSLADVDAEVAARLLYGSVRGADRVEYVQGLIGKMRQRRA